MREVFHTNSTFFGFLACACGTVVAGGLTHWNAPAMVAAFLAGLLIFPRAFYGIKQAKELDDTEAQPGSFFAGNPRRYDYGGLGGSSGDRLVDAYLETQLPGGYDSSGRPADPGALRKLAEEEGSH